MTRTALSLLFTVLAVLLGACGGGAGGSGADADPASLAPASAGFYAEALAKPEGSTREGALAAVGKVGRTPDPEAKLRELLDEAAKES